MEHAHGSIATISEELAALRSCLLDAGILRQAQLEVKLHKQRFRAACDSSKWIPDATIDFQSIVRVHGMDDHTLRMLGHGDVRSLALASKGLCASMHHKTSTIYIIAGGEVPGDPASKVERLNSWAGKWEVMPYQMPVKAEDAVAAVLKGRIYLCGVGFNDMGGQVMCFYPHMLRANRPWRFLPQNIPTRRLRPSAGVVGGKLYVCGGVVPGSDLALASVECFHPYQRDAWEILPSMNKKRVRGACARFGGQLLVCGGHTGGPNWLSTIQKSAELYNPGTGMWTMAPDMIVNREAHCAAGIASGVHVCGGCGGDEPSPLRSAEVLRSACGSWVEIPSMLSPRAGAGLAILGESIHIFGGSPVHAKWTDSVERYCPDDHVWEPMPKMRSRLPHLAVAVIYLT